MTDREQEWVDERAFDAMLEGSIPSLPPDDIAAEVTPWKRAMNRVLTGMALNLLTLEFLCLDYILPAVGMVLMLLGFRALRRENRWFWRCYVIAVIQSAYMLLSLIANTTVLHALWDHAGAEILLRILMTGLWLADMVCLWRGFLAVRQKAGLPPHAGGAAALIVWYGVVCLLALVQYSGWIIGLGMIAGYCFIIRSLCRLSRQLDEAGYAILPAQVRVTDRCIVLSLAALLTAGCVCGYAFGGSYPMDWTAQKEDEHSAVSQIKAELLTLGFPEYVLDDLTAEDIAACDGALRVVVQAQDGYFNDDEVPDMLHVTGVAVELPGEWETWRIFHHFLWTEDPGFYGTEAIQIWPAYQSVSEDWIACGEVTGRVLCDRQGQTCTADYAFLGSASYRAESFFGFEQTNTDLFAAFSMPRGSARQRGYVAYGTEKTRDINTLISSWFNYLNQKSWMQYPAETAMENRMRGDWGGSQDTFRLLQTAIQFYPAEEAKP